jgi:hypothetical protein
LHWELQVAAVTASRSGFQRTSCQGEKSNLLCVLAEATRNTGYSVLGVGRSPVKETARWASFTGIHIGKDGSLDPERRGIPGREPLEKGGKAQGEGL